jgi:hypothetical protein
MLQMGNQDHNSHRNIQPDFRCDLFADPLETAWPGAAVFDFFPLDERDNLHGALTLGTG